MAPSRGRRRSKGVGVRRAPCSPSVPKAAALGRPHLLRPPAEEGLVRPALARRESTPSSPLEPPRPKVLLTGAPHLAQTRASRSSRHEIAPSSPRQLARRSTPTCSWGSTTMRAPTPPDQRRRAPQLERDRGDSHLPSHRGLWDEKKASNGVALVCDATALDRRPAGCSYFLLLTSYFLLLTSYFLLLTSY